MMRYFLDLSLALGAYALVLMASLVVLRHPIASDALRHAISLAPMLPALAVLWVILRHTRRLDEMQRRIQFEALAFSFAGTALFTFSYGFLENVGWPRLSMFAVWPLMAALWAIGTLIANRRYG